MASLSSRVLQNEYWLLRFDDAFALLRELRFDPEGRSNWCPNLLKTGSPGHLQQPLAALIGGQTGYTDAGGVMCVSSVSNPDRVSGEGTHELHFEDVLYGAVREQWRLTLHGPRLQWTVGQEWQADTELTDAFLPALFFSATPDWGVATVFQLWRTDMAHDDFYDGAKLAWVERALPATRHTAATAGEWTMAKFLSGACPKGDLRVTASGHLKKTEFTNYLSYLGQTSFCEPQGRMSMAHGQTVRLEFTLEPTMEKTGLTLDADVAGPLAGDVARNRRFYDTHVNCGIMADSISWRFGNQPSGYVAYLCNYIYSEMARFGVPAGSLGPSTMDPHRVFIHSMRRQAESLRRDGNCGPCYFREALDTLPAYLASWRDVLSLTGDRALGEELLPGSLRAFTQIAQRVREGGGFVVEAGDRCRDYWDWIVRNGAVGSINVMTHMGLLAFAEAARWLGQAAPADEAQGLADDLAVKFNAQFWDEERGFYADWIDRKGEKHFHLYAGPQTLGIVNGLIPPERGRRVLAAIRRRRRELGPEWENCFSIQTNFYDAQDHVNMFQDHQSDFTRFGYSMNGGCLVSWNYYWIGALATVGLAEEAIAAWRRVVDRFARTSLIEGSNIYDYSGKPSRMTLPDNPQLAYEPFLADQGLASAALMRWLLGINPALNGLSVHPVAPLAAGPAEARVLHLGKLCTVRLPEDAGRLL